MTKDGKRELNLTGQGVNRTYTVLVGTGWEIVRVSGEVVFVEMSGQLPFCLLYYETLIFFFSPSVSL